MLTFLRTYRGVVTLVLQKIVNGPLRCHAPLIGNVVGLLLTRCDFRCIGLAHQRGHLCALRCDGIDPLLRVLAGRSVMGLLGKLLLFEHVGKIIKGLFSLLTNCWEDGFAHGAIERIPGDRGTINNARPNAYVLLLLIQRRVEQAHGHHHGLLLVVLPVQDRNFLVLGCG